MSSTESEERPVDVEPARPTRSASGASEPNAVRDNVLEFLEKRTRTAWDPDRDLFGSGLVSSLFALELVVHLENTFGVEIGADELRLDNFRTVTAMTGLITRLRGGGGD